MNTNKNDHFPRVTLVTITYNSARDLPEFFECVEGLDYPNINLVVVDNSSQDQSTDLVRDAQGKSVEIDLIVNECNLGVATANNQGICRGLENGSEWLILINNDVYFPADLVSKLIACDGDLVKTPIIPYYDQRDVIWFKTGDYASWRGFTGRHLDKNMLLPVESRSDLVHTMYAPACCMVIHRSVFQVVGMLDEDYFVYFEDTDFCYRLIKAGIKIRVVPDAFLFHKVGSSTGGIGSIFTVEQTSKNRIIYLRKNFGLPITLCFIPTFILYYCYTYGISKPSFNLLKLSIKSTFYGLTVGFK